MRDSGSRRGFELPFSDLPIDGVEKVEFSICIDESIYKRLHQNKSKIFVRIFHIYLEPDLLVSESDFLISVERKEFNMWYSYREKKGLLIIDAVEIYENKYSGVVKKIRLEKFIDKSIIGLKISANFQSVEILFDDCDSI